MLNFTNLVLNFPDNWALCVHSWHNFGQAWVDNSWGLSSSSLVWGNNAAAWVQVHFGNLIKLDTSYTAPLVYSPCRSMLVSLSQAIGKESLKFGFQYLHVLIAVTQNLLQELQMMTNITHESAPLVHTMEKGRNNATWKKSLVLKLSWLMKITFVQWSNIGRKWNVVKLGQWLVRQWCSEAVYWGAL